MRESACSWSTRPTACRSGGTTSAPTTSRSRRPPGASGARATIGLTATATPRVADDIARRLALRDPVRVTTGFDRPNLSFAVVRCGGALDKGRRIAAALGAPDALPAIVYAGTRDSSEQLAELLTRSLGEEVVVYHAGLDRRVRAATQERFMTGDVRVIVATNAFGMGIDKADVRTVCHASVPGSLEAYYQEAGRAGRDGRPSRCLLFAEQRDKGLHVFFIQRARVTEHSFEGVAERLRWAGLDGRYDVSLSDLAGLLGRRSDEDAVRAVIGHLARAGMVAPSPAPPDRAVGRVVGAWDRRTLATCLASAREAEQARWAQYRAVWEYVERSQCRRAALLAAFRRPFRAASAGGLLRHMRARVGADGAAPAARSGARRVQRRLGPRQRDRRGRALGEASGRPDPGGRDPPRGALEGGRPVRLRLAAAVRIFRSSALHGRARASRRAARVRDVALLRRQVPEAQSRMNVAVLASGEGTNLQALLDRVHGRENVEVVAVASDRPDARALERARAAGVATALFPLRMYADRGSRDDAIAAWLLQQGTDLVVLAGYMQLLSPSFLATFPHRVINVHPALLPAFPGLNAVEQALEYGVKVFGVTVHFVDEGVDTGPVILQRAIEVPDARDAADVLERLHAIEHELLPEAVRLIASGAVSFDPGNPRRVVIER